MTRQAQHTFSVGSFSCFSWQHPSQLHHVWWEASLHRRFRIPPEMIYWVQPPDRPGPQPVRRVFPKPLLCFLGVGSLSCWNTSLHPRLRSWALLETGLFFCIYPDSPPSACHRGTASPQRDATTVFGCRLVLMRWCSSPGFSPHIRREPLPNGSNFIWWEQGILWSESRSGLPAWAVLRLVLKNCFCLPFFLDDWSAAGTVVLYDSPDSTKELSSNVSDQFVVSHLHTGKFPCCRGRLVCFSCCVSWQQSSMDDSLPSSAVRSCIIMCLMNSLLL